MASLRRGLVVVTAVLALGVPPVALAQAGDTNPFSPGLPVSPAPTPTATTPTTVAPITPTTGGGSLSGGGIAAISVGAIVLLVGISFFIWRDARKRAPVRHRTHAMAGDGRSASKQRAKPRKLSPAERRRRKRGRAR